jgi:hypothetical protein
MFGKAYVALLEQELREWKIRYADLKTENAKLVNSLFAVQGAPAPFEEDQPLEPMPPRKTDQEFLAELEAEAAIATEAADRIAAEN